MNQVIPTQQADAGHVPTAVYTSSMQQAPATGPAPVIVVQAPAAPRQYGPLLLAATVGSGVLVAVLLAVSVVAVALAVGAIAVTTSAVVLKSLTAKGGTQ